MNTVLDCGPLLLDILLFRQRFRVVRPAPAGVSLHGRVHVGDAGVMEDAGWRVVAAEEVTDPLAKKDVGDVGVVFGVWNGLGGFVDCDCVLYGGAFGD